MAKFVTILPMLGYTRGSKPMPIPIPAGSPVEYHEANKCYYVSPSVFDKNSIEWHDAFFYGIVMPQANVLPAGS